MKSGLRIIAFFVAFALSTVVNGQIRTAEKVRFLALGDSYTIGQSVAVKERWPVQLIDSLRAKNVSCFDPTIIATTGWRTDNLSNAIQNAGLLNDYNLVSLLIGVNNQYQGGTAESYAPEFENLLNRAISLAGGDKRRVFVVSIPDYGFTPFGRGNQATITAGINTFNFVNRSISEAKGVTYINITEISRQGLDKPELVASDGLHPSGKMYTEWVKLILANLVVNQVVSAVEPNEPGTVTLYPNPTASSITIENLPGTAEDYRISLRDTTGKLIVERRITSNNNKAILDTQSLPHGVYFYELSGNGVKLKTGRFVKR